MSSSVATATLLESSLCFSDIPLPQTSEGFNKYAHVFENVQETLVQKDDTPTYVL